MGYNCFNTIRMKAIISHEYGSPDVLELQDIEKPTPKDNEVLIRLHATSVNSSDWEFLTGEPLYIRMWGLRKPKYQILGSDIAGRVEAVGRNAKQFQSGDDVFGDIMYSWGGFAEYVCANESNLVLKPTFMTWEEAAAIPQAAVVALQGLRDKGQVLAGQKVLINGAGGGAGTFALQLAKFFGAEVTGVDSTMKLDVMRSIGADHVIDHTKEDYTRNGKQHDLIVDLVAHRSIFDSKRALAPAGSYVMVGGSVKRLFQTLFVGSLISMMGTRKFGVLAHKQNQKDMRYITELVESGKVTPVIDRTYTLDQVPEAIQLVGDGRAKGKVIIII